MQDSKKDLLTNIQGAPFARMCKNSDLRVVTCMYTIEAIAIVGEAG
jgi:hypothetical protein